MKAIALTGATGSIGGRLVRAMTEGGLEVRAGVRSGAAALPPGVRGWRFCIGGDFDADALAGCAAVVHLAWAEGPDPAATRRANVATARALLRAARAAQVPRFVFISSMSAHARAESHYGRGKLEFEADLDAERDLAIRPGFVLAPDGICGRLAASLRRVPVVPLFDGGMQPIQTLAVDDLVAAVMQAIVRNVSGLAVVAHPEVLTIRAFYRALLAWQGQVDKPMWPLPSAPALPLLRACEALGLRLPMTSENLLGLRALRAYDVGPDLLRLGLAPQSHLEALARLPPRS